MDWKVGDWVVFDMDICQVTAVGAHGITVSDGTCNMSGALIDRLRPLTLRNKAIAEYFKHYYGKLRDIDGEAGFNYPDIHRHFSSLMLSVIDETREDQLLPGYASAREFVAAARRHEPVIQGVRLFRRAG